MPPPLPPRTAAPQQTTQQQQQQQQKPRRSRRHMRSMQPDAASLAMAVAATKQVMATLCMIYSLSLSLSCFTSQCANKLNADRLLLHNEPNVLLVQSIHHRPCASHNSHHLSLNNNKNHNNNNQSRLINLNHNNYQNNNNNNNNQNSNYLLLQPNYQRSTRLRLPSRLVTFQCSKWSSPFSRLVSK
jgi:hypothetical protein